MVSAFVKPQVLRLELLGALAARRYQFIAAALLGLMAINMVLVVGRKSITIDEIVMIPSAYYHLAVGNFDLVRDHPPLSKIIAAVPLIALKLRTIQPSEIADPRGSSGFIWAHYARFWEDNRAVFHRISFWARIPAILLTVALGILIFVFTRDLFGSRAAMFAAALFSLEPTVLAHGRVVQTDIPAAFGYLLMFFTVYRYLRDPSWWRASLVGVAGAVACLAKFSMLLTIPILVGVFSFALYRALGHALPRSRIWAHSAVAVLAALLVIQAAYGFHSRPVFASDEQWIVASFPQHATVVSLAVQVLSYILPTDFILGIFWQLWHNQVGHAGFLLGMYSPTGWWYYFPVAFALKTPIPFLLLSLAAVVWCAYRAFAMRDQRCLFVLAAFGLYTSFALLSRINIGVRYFLPAYALLFVMAGGALEALISMWRSRHAGLVVAIGLLTWMGIEAGRAYPNYMPYMNQLAAVRPHWELLSDSNLEWGDDIRELAGYLHSRGETRVRSAVLAGYMLLRYYDIENVDLIHPEEEQTTKTRYVAIGASFLNGSTVPGKIHGRFLTDDERVNLFAIYRSRQPETVIGQSIYVYRED